MSPEKRAETRPEAISMKIGIDTSEVTALSDLPPDEIPTRLKEDISRWKREVDHYREYFMERRINPFREGHEILLSFLNNFDKVAGMKAK